MNGIISFTWKSLNKLITSVEQILRLRLNNGKRNCSMTFEPCTNQVISMSRYNKIYISEQCTRWCISKLYVHYPSENTMDLPHGNPIITYRWQITFHNGHRIVLLFSFSFLYLHVIYFCPFLITILSHSLPVGLIVLFWLR